MHGLSPAMKLKLPLFADLLLPLTGSPADEMRPGAETVWASKPLERPATTPCVHCGDGARRDLSVQETGDEQSITSRYTLHAERITRRCSMWTAAAAILAVRMIWPALAFCSTGASEQSQPGAARQPNIVFILADDLSYGDLGCFGQKHIKTPNLDKLAAGGLVCNNAYAGGSWCAPSRTCLMTGLRADHWSRGRPPERTWPTVAGVLKGAGYTTGAVGKWHLQDDNKTYPAKRGFDTALIGYMIDGPLNKMNPYFPQTMRREDGSEVRFPENAGVDDKYVWSYGTNDTRTRMYDGEGLFKDKSGNTNVTYSEDVYREAALKFLRAGTDKPFFLYYATPLVHGPLGIKNLGRFRELPKDWDLKPSAATTFRRLLWAAMVEELARSVGVILDELKQLGVEKNTLVIFAADNGYAAWGYWNTGGQWKDDPFFQHKGPWDRGKFVNSNGGLRVPFIMSWPGTLAPGKTDRAVCFYDFMATCAELAKVPIPGPSDGVSWVPLLKGNPEQLPLRAELRFPKECDGNGSGDYRTSSVLLDERWFAFTEIGSPEFKTNPVRIFDTATDPGCVRDLSMQKKELSARALNVFTASGR